MGVSGGVFCMELKDVCQVKINMSVILYSCFL